MGRGDRVTRRRLLGPGRSFTTVILDMDGLMLDTEAAEFRAWQQAAADFGWSLSAGQYQQLVGRTNEDAWARLTTFWQQRPGARGSLEAVRDQAARYSGGEAVAVKDGLPELLGWAASQHVPVAVASSSSRDTVISRLEQAGVLGTVQAIAGGDEVTRGKPAPDIFWLAAGRLGAAAGDCVVLEDSDSGIRAAAAAGMTPLLVPDASLPRQVPADVSALAYRTCRSLTEALAVLRAAPAGRPGPGAAQPG